MLTGALRRLTSVPDTCTITRANFIQCILNEETENGGAISVDSRRCILSGCLFDGCSCNHYGGAIWATDSSFSLDDIVFFECSAGKIENHGGNAFSMESSDILMNMVAIHKCPTNMDKLGDGTIATISCSHSVRNINTSFCYSLEGEIAFSFFGNSSNSVKYGTFVLNSDYCLIHTGISKYSTLYFCNVVSNVYSSYFAMGHHTTEYSILFDSCSFVNNTEKGNTRITLIFENCNGDLSSLVNKNTGTKVLSAINLIPNYNKYYLKSDPVAIIDNVFALGALFIHQLKDS